MTEDPTNVAKGQAHRDPSPAAQGHLDAPASAEGDLRGIPGAAGRSGSVDLDRVWIVTACKPSEVGYGCNAYFVEADTPEGAQEAVESVLYDGEEKNVMDEMIAIYGRAVYFDVITPFRQIPVIVEDPS